MNQEMSLKLRRSLMAHEGVTRYPYTDHLGKVTIGIGYNLSDRGLDEGLINQLYEKDVKYFYERLYEDFLWFKNISSDRQIILIDMCFMGYKKFCTFKKMLDALSHGNYDKAADEMLNSKWAEQVKGRAIRLAQAMRDGVYDI